MARSPIVVTAVALAAGIAAWLLAGALRDESLAYRSVPVANAVVVTLEPRGRACQGPVDVPTRFGAVSMTLGTFFRSGQPLELTIESGARRVAARGRLAGGYRDNSVSRIDFEELRPGPVTVCLRNVGDARVAIYGRVPGMPSDGSRLTLNGKTVNADLSLSFLRARPLSALGSIPEFFRRATLFHPSWVGAWTFWLLAGAVVLAVPVLLLLALARMTRS